MLYLSQLTTLKSQTFGIKRKGDFFAEKYPFIFINMIAVSCMYDFKNICHFQFYRFPSQGVAPGQKMKGYFSAKKIHFLFVPNVCDLRIVSCDKYKIYSNFTSDCNHIDDIICNNCNGVTSFFDLRILSCDKYRTRYNLVAVP